MIAVAVGRHDTDHRETRQRSQDHFGLGARVDDQGLITAGQDVAVGLIGPDHPALDRVHVSGHLPLNSGAPETARLRPLVSGAQTYDTAKPISEMTAPASIVGPVPWVAMKPGSR